jgi:hypothetical protein
LSGEARWFFSSFPQNAAGRRCPGFAFVVAVDVGFVLARVASFVERSGTEDATRAAFVMPALRHV